MHQDPHASHEDAAWVAVAAYNEPLDLPGMIHASATAAQRNAIFDTVLGNPDSRGGHWPLDGISDIALSGSRGDTTLVRVTFDSWASQRNRDLAIRRLQGVPAVVARYVWLSGGGQKQVGTLRSAPVR